MRDAVAWQQTERKRKTIGFYGPCAAQQNEAGGCMSLALWVLFVRRLPPRCGAGGAHQIETKEIDPNLPGRREEGGSFVR